MWAVLPAFIFPLPTSLLAPAMAAISLASQAYGGINEALGNHVYSKFSEAGQPVAHMVPSKHGMVAAYSPALAVAVAPFAFPAAREAPGVALLASILGLHFFKRLLESPLLHRYSGRMALESATAISLSYLARTAFIVYTQYLTMGTAPPPVDLKPTGVALFVVGICGNLYHHVLLCRLRKKGEGLYKIPRGGLFGLVTCPHYLFEIMVFAGIACASQTVYSFCVMASTAFYLMGRSWATRKWYLSEEGQGPRTLCLLDGGEKPPLLSNKITTFLVALNVTSLTNKSLSLSAYLLNELPTNLSLSLSRCLSVYLSLFLSRYGIVCESL
ncbi:unnamed protein product [Spirodela intermedia]|uniref:3-oxo-5-alpha-steroid 4-dehydrogenase C-terminal domain-containing protein n=1 Tax=Spirodela intermedia TaxID=51605 RepID=A0A7I8JWH5_SPIIN|nr:unnamed protein product [Spirodela intermedia]